MQINTAITGAHSGVLASTARARTLNLVQELVTDLSPAWGGGLMSAAVYDVAWVAMVRNPKQPDRLRFPHSFDWLLKQQAPDGSWSGETSNDYALLPTLAALLALRKAPTAYQTVQTQEAACRAENFLRAAFKQWSVENHESVGFEVLAPELLEELESLGITFDFPAKQTLLTLYHQKLSIAAPELIYSGHSNLIHSLEAFGAALDFKRLKPLQATNGSYGCSPAATAAVLIYSPEWDSRAEAWLDHLSRQAFGGSQGAMPNAYPIDAFEIAWVVYNLAKGGFNFKAQLSAQSVRFLRDWLEASLTNRGGSITRHIGMPTDSDDTGMIVAALNCLDGHATAQSFLHFERENYFACFLTERGASLSANAHVLAALVSLPLKEQAKLKSSTEKVVNFLLGLQNPAGYWEDKWHISPYYATACTVMALADYHKHIRSEKVQKGLHLALSWVLQNQSEDGGWGTGGTSNIEDTAYAMQILQALLTELEPNLPYLTYANAIRRGLIALKKQLEQYYSNPDINRLPKLWRGKELYSVPRVVLSSALAVLGQIEGWL